MPAPSPSSNQVPSLAIPAVRAVRKEEDRRSYSLPSASGQSRLGAPLDPRLFSAEDADEPRTFSDLDPPSPNRVDPLTLSLSPAGTPDRLSFNRRPMRCP